MAPWVWWQTRNTVEDGRRVQTNRSAPSVRGHSSTVAATDNHLAVWQNLQQTLLQKSGDDDASGSALQDELQPIKDSLRETLGGLRQLIPMPSTEPVPQQDRSGMTAIRPDLRMG